SSDRRRALLRRPEARGAATGEDVSRAAPAEVPRLLRAGRARARVSRRRAPQLRGPVDVPGARRARLRLPDRVSAGRAGLPAPARAARARACAAADRRLSALRLAPALQRAGHLPSLSRARRLISVASAGVAERARARARSR